MTCPGQTAYDPVTPEEVRARLAARRWSLRGPLLAIAVAILALFVFDWQARAAPAGDGGTATVEYFESFPLLPSSNLTAQLSLPQFDPALGTLVGVQVCQRVFGEHEIVVMSSDAMPSTFEAVVQSRVQMFGPPVGMGAPPLLATIEQTTVLPPTVLLPGESATASTPMAEDAAETPIDPSAWSRYTGTGLVPFTLEVRAFGEYHATTANGSVQLVARTGARASVLYEYLPAGGAQ